MWCDAIECRNHVLSLHPEFTRTQPTACQSEPAEKMLADLTLAELI